VRLGIIGAQSGDSFVDPPPDRTSTQGARTRSIASTAPTSPDGSDMPFRPAAYGWPTRTSSIFTATWRWARF